MWPRRFMECSPLLSQMEPWDLALPGRPMSLWPTISKHLLEETLWRSDSRCRGRERIWCPGWDGRFPAAGWHQEIVIEKGRCFMGFRGEDLERSFPAFWGEDYETCDKAVVMGAVRLNFLTVEHLQTPSWDELLTAESNVDLAYEVGMVRPWDMDEFERVQELSSWVQFCLLTGISFSDGPLRERWK